MNRCDGVARGLHSGGIPARSGCVDLWAGESGAYPGHLNTAGIRPSAGSASSGRLEKHPPAHYRTAHCANGGQRFCPCGVQRYRHAVLQHHRIPWQPLSLYQAADPGRRAGEYRHYPATARLAARHGGRHLTARGQGFAGACRWCLSAAVADSCHLRSPDRLLATSLSPHQFRVQSARPSSKMCTA